MPEELRNLRHSLLVGGIPTPWKILVSWDDYSQYMEKINNVPNHQPVHIFFIKFMVVS
jgi:hypothetical protein